MSKTTKNEDTIYQEFSERLKALRHQKGLSQAELAELIGVHHTHVSRYERGDTAPAAKALLTLAEALEVSIDYLLSGKKSEAAVASIDDQDLLKMFKQSESLPSDEKELVKKFLGAFLNNKKIKELAS